MSGTRPKCAARNSHPGLLQEALNKQVNNDNKAALRGPVPTKEEKAAQATSARAKAARRVQVFEKVIAAEDAMDNTPQPKPGKKKAVRPRRVAPASEASEAPSPRPPTMTETESEQETSKMKKAVKEKFRFRKAVEEAADTDIEDLQPTAKVKGKARPKPKPKSRPLVRTESLLDVSEARVSDELSHADEPMDVSEDMSTLKPKNAGKRSKTNAKESDVSEEEGPSQWRKKAKVTEDDTEFQEIEEKESDEDFEMEETPTLAKIAKQNGVANNFKPKEHAPNAPHVGNRPHTSKEPSHKGVKGASDKKLTPDGNVEENLGRGKKPDVTDKRVVVTRQVDRKSSDGKVSAGRGEESERFREDEGYDVAGWATKTYKAIPPSKKSRGTHSVPSLAGQSRHTVSSKTSVSSKRSALAANVTVKIADSNEVEAGLSDRDEISGVERDYAHNSPTKPPNVRASSTSLIAVKSKRPKNNDLPPAVFEENAWRGIFLPTFFQWVATSQDPFRLDDDLTNDALLSISQAVYANDVDLRDKDSATFVDTKIFKLIMQRLQEWRGGFPATAIAVLTAYFEDDEHGGRFSTDEARVKFATHQLEHFRFLYRDAEGDDPKEFRGKFNGHFLAPVFAVHFNSIAGACEVHDLYSGDTAPYPFGALAVATTAIEQALTLWKDGNITIKRIEDSHLPGGSLKLQQLRNKATGRFSTRGLAFSDANWGDTVRGWLANIKKTKPRSLQAIMEEAKRFEKISAPQQNTSSSSSLDRVNERALLPDSDDESEA